MANNVELKLTVNTGNSSTQVEKLSSNFDKAADSAENLAENLAGVSASLEDETKQSEKATTAGKSKAELMKKAAQAAKEQKANLKQLNQTIKEQKERQAEADGFLKKTIKSAATAKDKFIGYGGAINHLDEQLKKNNELIQDTIKQNNKLRQAREALSQAEKGNRESLDRMNAGLENQRKQVAKNVRTIESLNSTLKGFVAGMITSFSFKTIFDTAQEVLNLKNSLKLTARAGEDVNQTLTDLFQVANNAQQPVEATAEAFNTLKKNTTALKLSQQDLLKLSSTVAKSIAIGGSSADAAKNSMIQFGQALSLGKLSGQNFNSVAEQTPGLVEAIAQGLHMTSAELKNYANNGQLTTQQVVTALQNAAYQTDQTFNKLGNTVTGAMNVLKNNFQKFVSDNDFFSDKIATGILFVANNIKLISAGIGLAVAAVIGLKAQKFIPYLIEVGEAVRQDRLRIKALGETTNWLSSTFSLLKVKSLAATVATRGLAVAIGVAKVAWVAFNQAFKATVVGAILAAAVWAVEKLINVLDELWTKWKSFTSDARKFNQSLEGKKANAHDLQENIKKYYADLKSANEDLEEARAKLARDPSNLLLKQNVEQFENQVNYLKGIINTQKKALDTINQEISDTISKQKSKLTLDSSDKPFGGVSGITVEAKQKVQPNANNLAQTTKLDPYQNQLKELNHQIAQARVQFNNLAATGKSSLSELDKVNLLLTTHAQGFTNLTKKQVEHLRSLATELDSISEKQAFQTQLTSINAANERLEYQLSLRDLSAADRQQKLADYDQEIQFQQQLIGLDQQHQQQLIKSFNLNRQLQAQLRRSNQSTMQSNLQALSGYQSLAQGLYQTTVSGLSKLVDVFLDSMTDAKVSFKDAVKEFIRNLVKVTLKIAIIQGLIMIGDAVTHGALSAVLNIVASASRAGFMSGGYTGDYGTNEVAGVVHGKEYVINADATRMYGHDMLSSINKGTYDPNNNPTRAGNISVKIINNAGVQVQAERNPQDPDELLVTLEPFIRNISHDETVKTYSSLKIAQA